VAFLVLQHETISFANKLSNHTLTILKIVTASKQLQLEAFLLLQQQTISFANKLSNRALTILKIVTASKQLQLPANINRK